MGGKHILIHSFTDLRSLTSGSFANYYIAFQQSPGCFPKFTPTQLRVSSWWAGQGIQRWWVIWSQQVMPLIRCGWPFSQSSAFPYTEGSGLLLLPKPWWPLGQSICIGVTRTLVRSADLHFDAIPQRIHRHDQVGEALGSETHANNPHASLFPAT